MPDNFEQAQQAFMRRAERLLSLCVESKQQASYSPTARAAIVEVVTVLQSMLSADDNTAVTTELLEFAEFELQRYEATITAETK
jgi:hypothetical protein